MPTSIVASSSPYNIYYYLSVTVCVVMGYFLVTTYTGLLPDAQESQNTKLMSVMGVFSVAASVTAYALGLYYFTANPRGMMQFMMIAALVLLPTLLIATTVSTANVVDLRNRLAGGVANTKETTLLVFVILVSLAMSGLGAGLFMTEAPTRAVQILLVGVIGIILPVAIMSLSLSTANLKGVRDAVAAAAATATATATPVAA